MHIDPHMAQDIADLGVRLSDTVARNTFSAIGGKIKAIKTKSDDRTKIQELEGIIYDLIDDKQELEQIAKAYKEKFIAQQISQENIEYITKNIIPALKRLIEASGDGNGVAAANMEKTLDILKSILSVETLTVLQLLGFNFKEAIGEPLTLLLQKFITSKAPLDLQSNAEHNKLMMAFNVELVKVAQDKDATERWERLKR